MTINLNINQTLILLRADGNVLYISLEKIFIICLINVLINV